MSANLRASLPFITVEQGMKLRLEALNPSTGATVNGVTIAHWAIYGVQGESTTADQSLGTGTVTWVWGEGSERV